MKKNNHSFVKMLPRALALAGALTLAVPQSALAWNAGAAAVLKDSATEQRESSLEVKITSLEQFLDMSKKCSSEAYTSGKTWVLDCDLDLSGTDFEPMGIFAGTFDGNGHLISGLSVTQPGSNQGLFRFVGEQAVIRNLAVEGRVAPSGSADNVGGIAGSNRGLIENCSFTGQAEGNLKTGGIAGFNESTGTIRGCTNSAEVNTSEEKAESGDGEESMSMDSSAIKEAVRPEKVNDAGGIAGFSEGVIEDCLNEGTVGRGQAGYNLGGIAGRQKGVIRRCRNLGTVRGRKDVGGIVGQMEPHLTLRYEEDTIQTLQDQMKTLTDLAGSMSDTVDGTVDRAEADVDRIGDGLDGLKNEARTQVDDYQDQTDQWRRDSENILDDLNDVLDSVDFDPSSDISRRVSDIKKSVRRAKELLESLKENLLDPETWRQLKSAMDDVISGIKYLVEEGPEDVRDAIDDLSDDFDSARRRLEDLTDLGLDQLEDFSDDLDQTKTDLRGRADLVSDDVTALKEGIRSGKNALRNQKQQLKDQIDAMEDTISDGIDRFSEDKDLVTDLSEEMDDLTPSAVVQCENQGAVEADFQAGGVVGTLGTELEGDPEADLEPEGDKSLNMVRQIRATVAGCRNRADVTTKGDHAGGIAGMAGLGALIGNESYGDVHADEGKYVGGIAGSSKGKLNGNFAFCTVFGDNYTGGIAGQGMDISGNRAMVTLDGGDGSEWRGSIAGNAEDGGDVRDNIYLENGLGAVDGVTYMDQARGVSYEELLAVENLPDDFKSMKVLFLADGRTVGEVRCAYGGAVDESQIPAVPEKDGYEGTWEKKDFSEITGNLKVEAVYRPWLTTIASSAGKHPVLLAEGRYHPADSLKAEEMDGEELDAVKASAPKGYRVLKAYAYELPEGSSQSENRLHLWAGDLKKGVSLAVMGQKLVPVKVERDGEYLVFTAGAKGVVAVMKKNNGWLWCAAAAVVLAAVLEVIRRRKRKGKRAGGNGPCEDGERPENDGGNCENSEGRESKKG